MRYIFKRLLPAIVLTLSASACERVVSVTVPSTPPRLVVEARLERVRGRVTGRQEIRLSTSDAYFSRATPPAVTNAIVRVIDSAGRAYPFTHSSTTPGLYSTDSLRVALRGRYTLRITWQGDEYASTETAVPGVPIDSAYLSPPADQSILAFGPPATDGGLRATIDITDPGGVPNYYLWDQFVDGRRIVTTDTTSFGFYRPTLSDELVDGGELLQLQPYAGIPILTGQSVLIRQIAIPAQAYRFYFTLSTQAVNDGSPFSVPPASVRGNVANTTAPSRLALGYFIVAEVTEATVR